MRNRADKLLAGVVLCSAILLALLWFSRHRSAPLGPLSPAVPVQESEARSPVILAMERSAAERSSVEMPVPVSEDQPVEPTNLFGRLQLDQAVVEGAWLSLSSVDGSFARRAFIDFEGRFRVNRVPIEALTLTIELPPAAQRIVLPPTLELSPQPGQPLELELDWHSKQVNLRVLDAERNGIPARVEVRGPHLAANLETGPDGTLKLTVIEAGRFVFHALTRGGQEGDAELELEPADELSSVMVVVRPEPAGNR